MIGSQPTLYHLHDRVVEYFPYMNISKNNEEAAVCEHSSLPELVPWMMLICPKDLAVSHHIQKQSFLSCRCSSQRIPNQSFTYEILLSHQQISSHRSYRFFIKYHIKATMSKLRGETSNGQEEGMCIARSRKFDRLIAYYC
jgi:hypothetical protein